MTFEEECDAALAVIRRAVREQWSIGLTLCELRERFPDDSDDDAVYRVLVLAYICGAPEAKAWLAEHLPHGPPRYRTPGAVYRDEAGG